MAKANVQSAIISHSAAYHQLLACRLAAMWRNGASMALWRRLWLAKYQKC